HSGEDVEDHAVVAQLERQLGTAAAGGAPGVPAYDDAVGRMVVRAAGDDEGGGEAGRIAAKVALERLDGVAAADGRDAARFGPAAGAAEVRLHRPAGGRAGAARVRREA